MTSFSAFDGHQLLFKGAFSEVVLKIKKRIGKDSNSSILIFSDATGKTMDFNFQGTEKDILKRLEVFVTEKSQPLEGPGRPRLGVVSREISLLPRHWEWLASQPGGASATLRKFVDAEMRKSSDGPSVQQAQERAYKFMNVMAGDLEGYEDALRALYRKDKKQFTASIKNWAPDVKTYVVELASPVF